MPSTGGTCELVDPRRTAMIQKLTLTYLIAASFA
jgi:hypothetical protein